MAERVAEIRDGDVVLVLNAEQVQALRWCLDAGWHRLDDGFPEPRDTNRKVVDSICAALSVLEQEAGGER